MHESCFILGEKRGLGMVALPFLIRLRLRFLSALRLLAGRFGARGTEDPIDLRSPRGYDLSLLARSRASHVFCVCPRPSTIEGAGDSAETTPRANDFEPVRRRWRNTQRPSVLRHLSSIHWTTLLSLSPERETCRPGSRRRHTGDFHTVSERRRDGCCECAVVIRPVPVLWIRGWFA